MKIYYRIKRINLLPGTCYIIEVIVVPSIPTVNKPKEYFPASYNSKYPVILSIKTKYRKGLKRLSKKSLEEVFSSIKNLTSIRFLRDTTFYENWDKIEKLKDAKTYWNILKQQPLGRKFDIIYWFFKEGEGLE